MRKSLVGVVAVGLLASLGCAGHSGKAGTGASDHVTRLTGRYVHPTSPDIYMEFKGDGTFCDKFGRRVACGKYALSNNHATLIFDSGKTFEFAVEGNVLMSTEGGRYIKNVTPLPARN